MTRENCEPWGYVAPVVAANDVAALVRRATHLLNCYPPPPFSNCHTLMGTPSQFGIVCIG